LPGACPGRLREGGPACRVPRVGRLPAERSAQRGTGGAQSSSTPGGRWAGSRSTRACSRTWRTSGP